MDFDIKKDLGIFVSHKTMLVASGVLGAMVYVMLFGFDTLIFTNVDWIYNSYNDINQHYIGWVYYRNSDWSFPLGVFKGLCGEGSSSLVYTDSIPLFAFFFKLFSGILPEHFQYLGMFTFISVILQAVLGNELIYRLTKKTVESFLASFFFLSATVMGQRLFEHTSLTCHAIIIAAIILFLKKEDDKNRIFIEWNLLLILSVLIHAYYVPMVLGFELFYYIKEKTIKDWYVIIVRIVSSIIIVLFVMYITGYFYGANYTSEQGWLWQFGTSLNAFWSSQGRSFTSLIYNGRSEVWELEEGYAYLGMGMIILSVIAIFLLAIGFNKTKKNKQTVFLVLLALIFGILSMIPTIRWNWDWAISIPLPGVIEKIMGIFRSNGRFIWPTFYIFIAFSCVAVIRRFTKRSIAIIGCCVIIQFLDLLPFYMQMSDSMKDRLNNSYKLEMMDEVPGNMNYVMLMGDVNSEEIDGFDFEQSIKLGNFAGDRNICISDYYIARKDKNIIEKNRNMAWLDVQSGKTMKNVLYVFPTLPYELLAQSEDLYYYSMDNMIVALNSSIDSMKPINMKDGINIIELDGYIDVDLNTMEGVMFNPIDVAEIGIDHCLYKELSLQSGVYKIEVDGCGLEGLGINVAGENLEYDVQKVLEDKLLINIIVNEQQTVHVQLFNSTQKAIDVNGLVIYN